MEKGSEEYNLQKKKMVGVKKENKGRNNIGNFPRTKKKKILWIKQESIRIDTNNL